MWTAASWPISASSRKETVASDLLEKIHQIGILPVITLDDAAQAAPLAKAPGRSGHHVTKLPAHIIGQTAIEFAVAASARSTLSNLLKATSTEYP